MKHFTLILTLVVAVFPVNAQKLNEAYLRAKAAIHQSLYVEAVQEIGAIPENERTADMYLSLGESYYRLGRYDEAIGVFAAADKVKSAPEATLYAARIYAQTGQPAKAAEYLQQYLGQRDKLSESELQFDPALEKMERSKEWRALWEKEWYNAAEQKSSEASLLLKRKKYTEALNVIDEATARRASSAKLYALRAQVYEAMEQYEPALESYRSAMQQRSNDPAYYIGAASNATRLKKHEQALEYIQRAIRLDPYRLELYLQRAAIYRLSLQYDEARKDILFYFSYLPSDTKAIYQMGLAETEAGNPLAGIAYFTMLIEQDKTAAEYFTARAAASLKAGNHLSADDDLAQALDLNPKSPEIWLQKGIALHQADKSEEACHCWNKAMQLGSKEAGGYIHKYCYFGIP